MMIVAKEDSYNNNEADVTQKKILEDIEDERRPKNTEMRGLGRNVVHRNKSIFE